MTVWSIDRKTQPGPGSRIVPWLLVLLALALLGACGDNSTSAANGAALPPSVSAPPHGSWRGVLLESRRPYPARLSLEASGNGTWAGTFSVSPLEDAMPGVVAGQQAIDVTGTYNPALGAFTLATPPEATGPALIIDVAVAGDGALATLFEQRAPNSRGRRRAEAYLANGPATGLLEQLPERHAALTGWRPAPAGDDCPAALSAWRDQARAQPAPRTPDGSAYNVFRWDTFAAAFGAPYPSADVDSFKRNAELLRGACRPTDRAPGQHADQLAWRIASPDSHREFTLQSFVPTVTEGWVDARRQVLASNYPMSERDLGYLEDLWRHTGLSRYGYDIRDLQAHFQRRRQQLAADAKRAGKLELYDQYRDRFDLLLRLAETHAGEDAEFRTAVQARLDNYLPMAAASLGDTADRPGDARFMLAWTQQVAGDGGCPLSDEDACESISENFLERIEDLGEDWAEELEDALEQLEDRGEEDLATLAAQVTFAREASAQYGELLQMGDLADAWEEIADARHDLQEALHDPLLETLAALRGAAPLIDYEQRYFLREDLRRDELEDIDTVLAGQLSTQAPFRALAGGDYLDALVNRDKSRLKALDQDYTRGMKPLFTLGLNSLALLNPGITADIERELANLSAIYAVFGTYLLDYQRAWPDCLGADAARFEITSRSETVTSDSYGRELYRSTNWIDRDEYAVPGRLARYFQQLWRADFQEANARFMDSLFNDRRINQLVDGTRRAMADNDCRAPAIQDLERGMITYFSDVMRRTRGRTALD